METSPEPRFCKCNTKPRSEKPSYIFQGRTVTIQCSWPGCMDDSRMRPSTYALSSIRRSREVTRKDCNIPSHGDTGVYCTQLVYYIPVRWILRVKEAAPVMPTRGGPISGCTSKIGHWAKKSINIKRYKHQTGLVPGMCALPYTGEVPEYLPAVLRWISLAAGILILC